MRTFKQALLGTVLATSLAAAAGLANAAPRAVDRTPMALPPAAAMPTPAKRAACKVPATHTRTAITGQCPA